MFMNKSAFQIIQNIVLVVINDYNETYMGFITCMCHVHLTLSKLGHIRYIITHLIIIISNSNIHTGHMFHLSDLRGPTKIFTSNQNTIDGKLNGVI